MPRLERLIAIMIALCAVVVSSTAFAEDGKAQTVQTQKSGQVSGQVSGQNFPRDSWFAVSIAGTNCGWMHEKFEVFGDRIQTSNEIRLTLGRAGASTTVRVGWKFIESSDGTPIECEVQQVSGSEVSRTIYRFSKTEVAVDETAGGRTLSRKMPSPEGIWWTPAQVERNINARRKDGATEITYRTVDPSSGLRIVDMVSKRMGEGEAKKTIRWLTTNSAVPMPTEEEVDADGDVIISSTKMAIGDMIARRCSESQAKRSSATGGVDLIDRSMVSLAKPSPELLTARHARIAVRSTNGDALVFPASGAQRFEANPAGGLFVDIDVGRTSLVTAEELADARYLASSILIDAKDPAVIDLALRAVSSARLNETSPVTDRAEALRAFVMRFIIHKDLATAFAGASAVAQSKAGDCSEHAVLLAALLRAQGIPSRVASGMVYAQEFAGKRDVFAWHMWTQAQVDGAWIDLDATLSSRSFHPGHLLMATSAQDDAQLDADFSNLLSTMGNVSIEVVHVDR